MPELLQYDFSVVGAVNVERALSSLERRFAQHNAKMNTLFGGRAGGSTGGGSRAGGGGLGAGTGGMAGAAAVREQTAMVRKVERERVASERRVERERISVEKSVAREQQRTQRYWDTARAKSRDAEMAAARDIATARSEFVRSTVGKGFGRVAGAVRAVGTAGLAMTGVGGAALASSAVSQAMDLDERARRLSIAARNKGELGADPNMLRKSFSETGARYGLNAEDVASGVQQYVADTGDLAGAMANRNTFAAVAQGEDAKMPEVTSTASALSQSMGINSPEKIKEAFAILSTQGKKGSFELKNQAQFLPEVLATAAGSNVTGTQGVRDVGALMQIGMRATHNAAETATSSNAMFRQLNAKAGDMASGAAFSGRRVHVYENDDPTKKMLPFADVVQNAISASRGNMGQLNETFDARGVKNLLPLISAYKDANNAAGGGEKGDKAGRAAIKSMFDSFSNVTGDFGEIERDAADAMKSVNVQLDVMSTELKSVVASELFPSFIALAKELPRAIEPTRAFAGVMVKLAGALIDHPLLGLGGLLGTAVAYEVGKASLGKVLEMAVTRLFSSGGSGPITKYTGTGTSGGTGGSVGGALGSIAVGSTIGISLASVILTTGIVNFENGEVNMKSSGEDLNKVRGASVDEIPMVEEKIKKARARLEELNKPGFFQSVDEAFGASKPGDAPGPVDAFFDDISGAKGVEKRTQEAALAEEETKLKSLQAAKATMEAATALKEAAAAQKAAVPNKPNTGNSPSPVKS